MHKHTSITPRNYRLSDAAAIEVKEIIQLTREANPLWAKIIDAMADPANCTTGTTFRHTRPIHKTIAAVVGLNGPQLLTELQAMKRFAQRISGEDVDPLPIPKEKAFKPLRKYRKKTTTELHT